MKRIFGYLTGSTVALLASAAFSTAIAAPPQAMVDEARAECRAQKQLVKGHEAFARDEDRRAWETACGRANALMDGQRAGTAELAAFEISPDSEANQAEPAHLQY